MKQKSKLFFNIATIALCICAIAVGVYSAKTASLNVGGSIGFVAHGADVDVMVYMYGHATAPKGTPVGSDVNNRTQLTSSAIQVRGADVTQDSLFSTVYFTDAYSSSDKPQDIVLVFEFTNQSQFDLMAKLEVSSCTCPENISIASSGAVALSQTGEGKTGTMSVTLSLNATEGAYTSFTVKDLLVSIKFEKLSYKNIDMVKKFTADYVSAGSAVINEVLGMMNELPASGGNVRSYVEAFPYYIEMGSFENVSLKWLIVGKLDASGAVVALDDNDYAAFDATGMVIGTNYVVLSEYILDNTAMLSSRSFSSSEPYTNTSFNTNANDYATSDIRALLKEILSSLFTEEELALIQDRSIETMYSTDTIVVANTSELDETLSTNANGVTFPSAISSNAELMSPDKLWLLSETEMRTIFAQDSFLFVDEETPANIRMFPSAMTTILDGNFSEAWWLRSPSNGTTDYSRVLYVLLCTSLYARVSGEIGLRPAFII